MRQAIVRRVKTWIVKTLTSRRVCWPILSASLILLVACRQPSTPPQTLTGSAPEVIADQIHRVLAADRTAYAKYVVERAQVWEGDRQPGGVLDVAVETDWERRNALPVPCHFFNLANDFANEDGDFTYGLTSPWPLDDGRLPQGELDQRAVAQVVQNGQPYRAYRTVDRQPYFTAFYPDRAVVPACVSCHNRQREHRSRYPEKVFALGDVMGAMWINLPLQKAGESESITPSRP
ncbi:MAG: DUF3365 domain-containing protein [Synechococcales cyanobacterium CRU_2_2]|nr:DUF3365 domain-containing protein [Synechococcales cyanobacterium CRU_2_2]